MEAPRLRRWARVAWLAVGILAAGLGALFAAAGKVVGLALLLAGIVAIIVALRAMLRPRVVRRAEGVAPIATPPRDALDQMEWPHAACPRCGFMDLTWGGPARLVARCVRCGFTGEPGIFDSPHEFEEHLEALRRAT